MNRLTALSRTGFLALSAFCLWQAFPHHSNTAAAHTPRYGTAVSGRLAHEAGQEVQAVVTSDLPDTGAASVESSLDMIRQLRAAGDEEGLFRMTSLLSNPDHLQGIPVARRLLADRDAGMRQTGIDILTGSSLMNPEIHRLALDTLKNEQDSRVLVHMLNKLDAPVDLYGKDTDMLATLHGLLNSPVADVRAQALLQLLQWDDYSTLEGYLYQAVNDPSSVVRLSAATVIGLIDTRSETLKGALINLRDNPTESRDIHETAQTAIKRIETIQQDNLRDSRTANL